MRMNERSWVKKIGEGVEWLSGNRVVLLIAIVCILIFVLFVELYRLQIVSAAEFSLPVVRTENRIRRVELDAPRGNIYDRFGRPLAVNIEVDVIRIDPATMSRPSADNTLVNTIIEFVRLAGVMGDEVVVPNTIRITKYPYEFSVGMNTARRNWLRDMSVIEVNRELQITWLATRERIELEDITAEMVMERLIEYFRIPEQYELPQGVDRRVVLEIMAAVYMERINFNQITVARDVSRRLVVAIEERGAELPNFYADVEYLRYYPAGAYVSHIIGYIRAIQVNENDMETFGHHPEYRPNGYRPTDMFGRMGIERSFQMMGYLSGDRGIRAVELDPMGRRVSNNIIEPAVPGQDVFLTLDLQLQMTTHRALRDVLVDMLIARMEAPANHAEPPFTPRQVIQGLLRTNNIYIASIMEADSGFERTVRTTVEAAQLNPYLELETNEHIRDHLITLVGDGVVAVNTMLGVLVEQGVITATELELMQITINTIPATPFLVGRIRAGELTVQMIMPEAHGASAVAVCVNTGAVLAAANYPSFDNNRFVNTFDNAYFNRVNTDPTSPMFNRAFSTNRAPGSTFKMITAVAGLESGTITPNTIIRDNGTFWRTGEPVRTFLEMHFPGASNGNLNVAQAIEVSCNYFFYETSWRLGDNTTERIDVLSDFMERFGLNSPAGVEIGAAMPTMAAPHFTNLRGEPDTRQWSNHQTVTAAIGQSFNAYSSLIMAKYTATLANGGYRWQSHLLSYIANSDGTTVRILEPVLEAVVGMSPQTVQAVHAGMYGALHGDRGTARGAGFGDLPFRVGGKTGTAQNGTAFSDVTFNAFAPFDNPQIAVYVMIPFGDTVHISLPAERIAKAVLECFFQVNNRDAEAPTNGVFTN